MIKARQGFVLKAFSRDFCPIFLVKILKLFRTRETAFAFFKFAFRDGSDATVRSCCIAAHILAAEDLRFLAQDVVSCVITRIGSGRSEGLVELMWREHHKYESDFSVLDTLMRGFLNVEMSKEAMGVLDRMREVGLRPSLSAITILFKLLLRVGDYGLVRIGESLLHVMWKFHCEPDVFTYNIVINAYCIRGQTSDAISWVHLMIARGCKPNVVTFNTLLHALCKEGNMVEARKLFEGIHDMGVYPDITMFNTLIDGYVKARDIDQANMIYEEMRKRGVSPDGVTFNILVAGHYKFGREEDGDRLLRDVSVLGLFPDSSLYDISVAGLCWAGRLDEAMEFLEKLLEKGIPPSMVAFNSIIAAYSRAGLEAKGHKQWVAEVQFLGIVEHPNLVKLIGYCAVDGERGIQRLLVYEYMPNKSLEHQLFNRAYPSLPWKTRLQIILGAAQGLAYLHEGLEVQVIFRDFKSSNVLLDEDFKPKLSDFGLAREGPMAGRTHVSTAVVGTYGYAAPEYIETGHLTRDQRKETSHWQSNETSWNGSETVQVLIMDSRLEGQYSSSAARKIAKLADNCLLKNAKDRPTMSQVVERLKQIILQSDEDNTSEISLESLENDPVETEKKTNQAGPSESWRRRMAHLANLGENVEGASKRRFMIMQRARVT
uniref:non-specific serine/threonine protein kinase n=1 Tax=Fagus sylvatica TaxID=28930 RepID=A0A2N9GS64_FAGSY